MGGTASWPASGRVLDDGTTSNEDRLGAIGDIRFTIEQAGLGDDDLFVVAGDNLIGYDLRDYVRFWRERDGSAIALRHEPDPELIKQYGVVELDDDRPGRLVRGEAGRASQLARRDGGVPLSARARRADSALSR